VFGGTFDPVHRCHLRLAEFVFDQGFLDQILFLPAANPPHKPKAIASFSHRIAMLKTALSGREKLSVSTLEARRRGPSYTVDSLRALQREYRNTRLFSFLARILLWRFISGTILQRFFILPPWLLLPVRVLMMNSVIGPYGNCLEIFSLDVINGSGREMTGLRSIIFKVFPARFPLPASANSCKRDCGRRGLIRRSCFIFRNMGFIVMINYALYC